MWVGRVILFVLGKIEGKGSVYWINIWKSCWNLKRF